MRACSTALRGERDPFKLFFSLPVSQIIGHARLARMSGTIRPVGADSGYYAPAAAALAFERLFRGSPPKV
jgi:hypothetical protein